MGQRNIVEKIKNIESEVGEFHPLLDIIFSKMNGIEQSDYTHGQNEMGADFLLRTKSHLLGDTEYIGVIAKTGKLMQDHADINRQIEECMISRFTSGGKKEIFLSEIWVVVNGTISYNAQRKINEKYKSQKVSFIDINKLSSWVEEYVPNYGTDISAADGEFIYKEGVNSKERECKFSLLPVSENSLYVDQEILQVNMDEYSGKTKKTNKKKINVFEAVEREKIIIIESQMGGGKSKLLNKIIQNYSDPSVYQEKKIMPIYLHSRDVFSDAFISVEDYVKKIKLDNVLCEDEERVFLLVIDGLDEIKIDEENMEEKIVNILDQLNLAERVKAIIATRPITNEKLEFEVSKKTSRYEIRPLTLKGVVSFVEKICSRLNIKTRLLEDLKKSPLFNVLPKTPIAAIILAKLLNEKTEDLPSNITELYAQYVELSLGRWDSTKGLKSHMEYEALLSILSEISVYMLDNVVPSLSIGETKRFFSDYLGKRNLKIETDYLFDEIVERSNILAVDSKYNTVSFKHKSFAEYFYAINLLKRKSVEISLEIFDPYMTNTYFFYVGLKKDCPELLSEIINLPVEKEGHRFAKMVSLGDFLLAGYSTPYSVISRGVLEIFKDSGRYYLDISNNKINSPLAKFPRMQLLALFRHILHENYSYSFFQKAISDSLVEICTLPKKDESSVYSMFFLDVARIETGGEKIFDNLVEFYDDTIPLQIQLALGHEADKMLVVTPQIKRIEKRIRKHAKTSMSFRSAINNLYDESIDKNLVVKRAGKKISKKI